MRIISVLNDKGGVGKTIIASLLTDAALLLKKKVLVIDLDPQATLSRERLSRYLLDRNAESVITPSDPSLADFLSKRGDIWNYVIGLSDHIFPPPVIESPSDFRLATIWPGYHLTDTVESLDPTQIKEGYEAIETWLENMRQENQWDYCIIDNPPNRSGLSKRLALLSDVVVIPTLTEPGSYEATARTITTIGTTPMIVVPNRYQVKMNIHKEYLGLISELRIPKIVSVADPIPSSPLYLGEQAQGIPTLLFRINMPAITASHDLITQALGLKNIKSFRKDLSNAHMEYKPVIKAYTDRITAKSFSRPPSQVTI